MRARGGGDGAPQDGGFEIFLSQTQRYHGQDAPLPRRPTEGVSSDDRGKDGLVLASESLAAGGHHSKLARHYVLRGDGRLDVVVEQEGRWKAAAAARPQDERPPAAEGIHREPRRMLQLESLRAVRRLLVVEVRSTIGRATSALRAIWGTLGATARRTFLPVGYPSSVPPEYIRYQFWDVCQNLASYLRGILATQALLEGMGVGRAGSTALAATIQWLCRDGASMLGGLVFTSVASGHFGTNIKSWRLFADLMNDVGITLEMLAPGMPQNFLAVICLASVCKAMCGVSAGACNGAITEHWALRNNFADVAAKNGAQHTVVTLAGLVLGLWFARFANASAGGIWASYVVLTVLHILACVRAMRTLALRSLNPARLAFLASNYVTAAASSDNAPGASSADIPAISLREAAASERLLSLPPWASWLWPWGGDQLKVCMGAPLSEMVEEADDLLWLTSTYGGDRAMLTARVRVSPLGAKLDTVAAVALREDAEAKDQVRAYYQACLVHRCLLETADSIPSEAVARKLHLRSVVEGSLRLTNHTFPAFWEALAAAGWDRSRVTLGAARWLGRWGADAEGKAEGKAQAAAAAAAAAGGKMD